MDKGKKIDGNNLLLYIIDTLLKLIIDKKEPQNEYELKESIKEYDLQFFDDNNSFYTNILSQLTNASLIKVYDNIKLTPDYILRYIIIFLRYLESIINSNKYDELYTDSIIKIDISILIGYLNNKYGEKIVESIEFFPLCIEELEKKYKILCNVTNTKYDEKIKNKAKEDIDDLFLKKKIEFQNILRFINKIL